MLGDPTYLLILIVGATVIGGGVMWWATRPKDE